jgi:ABC-type sugar transport system ATPase subunit
MNAGLVEQLGAPLDIYEKPASTFVASSFIGAPPMNLLPRRRAFHAVVPAYLRPADMRARVRRRTRSALPRCFPGGRIRRAP